MTGAIQSALEQFRGRSPDEIAALLISRRIKGRSGTTYGCPLAIALDATATGTFIIGRRYIMRRSGNKIEQVRTPPMLAQFIRKFDLGEYPALLAPAPRCLPKRKREGGNAPHKEPHAKRMKRMVRNHLASAVHRFAQ